MKNQTLTIQDAAKFLGVSTKTLRRWDTSGRLKPERTVGNQRRYTLTELEAFKNNTSQVQVLQSAEEPQFVSPIELVKQALSSQEVQPLAPAYVPAVAPEAPQPEVMESRIPVDFSSQTPAPIQNQEEETQYEPEESSQPEPEAPKENRPTFGLFTHPRYVMAMAGALSVVLLFLLVNMGFSYAQGSKDTVFGFLPKSLKGDAPATGGSVLAANDNTPLFQLRVNVPSVFGKQATFLDSVSIKKGLTVDGLATLRGGIKTENADIDAGTGRLTASNVVYSIVAGNNVTITGDPQNPTISASFGNGVVTSFQGQTGQVALAQGSGIGLDGLTITNTGVLTVQGQSGDVTFTGSGGVNVSGTTITNTDPGSAQNIFKSIIAGNTTIDANSNNDSVTFAAGSGITITGDSGSKTITITSNAGGGISGLTPNGVLYAQDSTTAVTTAPGTTGTVLKGVTAGAPVFGAVDLNADVTGILSIVRGGTGLSATPTNGQLLIGNGTGYSLGTLTAGPGIDVTNGSGTINVTNNGVLSLTGTANQITTSGSVGAITLSLPQDIATTSNPTFTSLNLTANVNQLTLGTGNSGVITLATLTSGQTYTLPDASGEICLSSGNCPSGGGGNISGSGTSNYIPKFTGASAIGNSLIYDTGTKLGIGTTSPQGLFSVVGGVTGQALVSLNETGDQNILVGSASGTTRFVFDRSGNLNLNGGGLQINGTSVLTSNTLGSGVTTSSLTSVSTLNAGSIGIGFGSIDVGGDDISGGNITATGTTGLTVSGNGAGLTFTGSGNHIVSASSGTLQFGAATLTGNITGNGQSITGLNNLSAAGTITFSSLSAGVVKSDGAGNLSSSAVGLGTSDVTGTLGPTNGGTGLSSYNIGDLLYASAPNTLATRAIGTNGQILTVSGGVPVWTDAGGTVNFWQRANGAISPLNVTDDFLLGGNSTASAKFAVSGTTGNATTSGNLTFNTAANIQTTANQSLTIGGATTGNIILSPQNGAGLVAVNGSVTVSAGNAYQINGANVLTSTTLGSSVTGSSLTGVGALNSGSIVSGFGTITTANTITGSTLNGTTGINTGAGAGTQRIDASGNLANIGTINASGAITFTNLGAGVVKSSAGGLLSSGAVGLNTADVTGTLPVANGGTGSTSVGAAGSVAYSNGANYSFSGVGTSGQVLVSNGSSAPTWANISSLTDNYWQRIAGAISPLNITDDLLIGGTATSSAKFQVFGNTGSASTSGNLTFNGANTIQTTNNQTLTIGGDTTGNITLSPLNGNGSVTSTGNLNLVTSKAYQINGANVLTETTLGSSVLTSSLTSVGALTSGSIGSGFGTIATTNTITGTTLNGTTGINTGAGAGTQRIDASGNLANIGTINAAGAITFSSLGTGIVQSNGSGLLSSAALNLGGGSSYVTGILPSANGGTGDDTSGVTGVPYITAGNWQYESQLSSARGGTGSDLSAATQGSIAYFSSTGVMAALAPSTSGYVLQTNGAGQNPSWVSVAALGNNYWQRNNGTLSPLDLADDFAVGGNSTASAKFQVFSGTGNATTSGTLTFNTAGNIQTTNNQTLTFGGDTTGNITLSPLNGNGTVTSTGNLNLLSGKAYQINGANVLTETALGSSVVSSSLTSVGALASGSIANGFGTIATANTITGTTLNGTTGINTGAGAGTQRIDASGNLANIGTINASGAITFTNLGAGIVKSSAGGLLSSSAIDLATAEVTGTLPVNRGGTGTASIGLAGAIAYSNGSNYAFSSVGTSGQVLVSNGSSAPSWVDAAILGTNYWQRNVGALSPLNVTDDLLIGGNATSSAKFQIFAGTGNATTSGNLTFNAASSIQTTNNQTLTIGGDTTGNITLSPLNGNGTVTSTGNLNLLSGKGYQINGSNVLTETALGSSVVSSSLTSVGALTSGSIGSGFGTIATTNTITGTTLNGTTGINTGAGAGTQRIDASGNLANIGTINAAGAITFSNLGTGVVQSNGSGLLSSSALNLAGGASYITGVLPTANGGTGDDTSSTTGVPYLTAGNWQYESQLSSARGGTGADLSAAIQGSIAYFSSTGVMSALAPSTSGYVLQTNGNGQNPTWVNAATLGTNYWQRNAGTLSPLNVTDDVLVGGTSTASAKFQIFAGSGNATTSGTLTFNTASSIQTTANQTLTIGGDSTGNITLSPLNGNGTVTSTGNLNLLSGKAYQINGANVLTETALGSSVVSSSLTSVGALASGSIANGFGTIATGNTITGTTLNGTTGINTGAGAGTQRIDASGNLANIGTINASGAITFTNLGAGVVKSSAGGLLSSSAIDLATAEVTGTLPVTRGGTGATSVGSAGSIAYSNGSTYAFSTAGTSGQILQSNGSSAPTWVDAATLGTNYWQRNVGTLSPLNITDDLLVGGTSTASAKFQIFGNTGNATTSGNLTFNAASSIQTTNNQTLTIGGDTTGNITLSPLNGNGSVTSTGNLNLVSSKAYQINGSNVLTSTALGSSVVSSSLTSVGALTSGSIGSGFGTIATANTITGTTLNGTTGINTGAGAGTQRIDASGNLANIGTINASGAITFTNLGSGVVKSSAGGLLSSSAVGLNTSDVTGILAPANGGTGDDTSATTGVAYIVAGNWQYESQLSSARGGTGANLSAAAAGALPYFSTTGVMSSLAAGTAGQVLQSNGASSPSWVDAATLGTNYWQRNAGTLSPLNITDDLLVGGTATSSAKFQVFGNTGNASTSGTLTFNTAGNILTTNNQTLTIGGASTGNITLSPQGGNGTVTSTGNLNLATGKAYQINGANVLTETALGSSVVSSSLTSVGALNSGSIGSGFGTIATTNTITGTTLNGTTGINTGAGAGTQRIDASGNLANIGTINASGAITFTNLGAGVVKSSAGGLLSSSAVGLNTADVTGTLPVANGGTGVTSVGSAGTVAYSNGSTYAFTAAGTSGQVLQSNGAGAPSWVDAASLGTNYWQRNAGTLSPLNITDDLLVGGTSTASAKFQIFGNTGNATTSGNLTFNAASSIQTTNNQTLTIGGDSTGNITLSPLNGNGTVTSTGNLNLSSGKGYQINGANVLTSTALGSSVVSSSLTSVGALTSGSIGSGFGTIATTNTITGTTLNGTTGINTGAGAGTQRIDASGNIVNAGSITANGTITFSGLNTNNGLIYANGSGVLAQTAAGTSGQLLVANVSGVPTYVTLSGDATLAANGALTISSNAVALGTDTTGDYVASITSGNGISAAATGEGSTPTIALGALTSDWNQTGAFDIVLNNSASELKILESTGGTYFGSIDIGDLSADRVYTFPNESGDVCLSTGNCAGGSGGSKWQVNSGVLAPLSPTNQVVLGGNTATDFQFEVNGARVGKALVSLNETGNQNILTASASGSTVFNITRSGGIQMLESTGGTYFGSLSVGDLAADKSYILPNFTGSSAEICLSIGNCAGSGGGLTGAGTAGQISFFTSSGNISSETTGFAWDAISKKLGIGTDTPTGKLDVTAGNAGKALVVFNETGDQNILVGSASGTTRFVFDRTGNLNLNGGAYQIGGTTVLSSTTLGSTVTGSSLTSVGALASGSIASGFGTIATTNTITGTTLNGTTGINTGAGAGTQRIDASGNLSNIGTINASGAVTLSNYTTNGGLLYTNGSGALGQTAAGTAGQVLQSNGGGAPTWVDAATLGTNFWQRNAGALSPLNITDDLLVGGTATSSAKFQVFGNTGNATTSGTLTFNAAGSIQTTNNQTLTIGGTTTGNITLAPQNGNGTVTSTGNLSLSTGKAYQINGSNVLTETALGSSVVSSSLTSVGALTSGSIANGFGTIATANTITGTTLNGTTGINTGAGAGTQRIDASGNLANIGTINASGAITFTNLGAGVVKSSAGGLLSSSAVGLNTADVTGTLPVANGGTGVTSVGSAGSIAYSNGSTYAFSAVGSAGQVLQSNGSGAPTWVDAAGLGTNYWQRNAGTLSPLNITDDLLVGGTSTASAKFQIFGNTGNATTSGSLTFNAASSIQTTRNQTLTIGGDTTGNITLSPLNGNGTVTSTGNLNLLTGKAYQINGANVLTSNTLGSGVVTSSLTTVGALTSGSIGSGFGTIATTNTITGTTLNGTTGINTGAGAGTQRIDASGNLSNIGTINASGAVTFTNLGAGVVKSSAGGLLSSSAVGLNTSDVTGVLPSANGGTGADLSAAAQGSVPYFSATGIMAALAPGTSGYVLQTNGAGQNPTWVDATSLGTNYWQRNAGTLSPLNITDDLLVGGTATSSAKFQIFGNTGNATTSGTLTLNSAGSIQTTNNQTLTIGGASTGNITLAPQNGNGTVTSTGNVSLATGKAYQINGSNVLTSTALGSSVVSSSLTSVGALSSGSIASGFGTIATTNTITGTTLNGTTGINTGAGAGTQRIDASGNLANIGTINASGAITFTNLGAGVVKSSAGGLLSSSAIDLATAEVTGTLPVARGGTGATSVGSAGSVSYSNGSVYSFTGVGTSGQVLQSNGAGAPTWVDAAVLGTNYWQRNVGTLSPLNITDDLLVGGTSTASAKFQIFGNTGNASTSGTLTLNSAGSIQTTNNQTLTIGGASTGNITLAPQNGNGTVTSTGNLSLSTGKAYQINGSNVLTSTALGSSVVSSSLTSVGALSSGSIASGFGTIATTNTITGTTLNGTTGINTGAGAGTQRIDASGNLSNIGTINAAGAITFSNLGTGVVQSNGSGLLSSSALNLAGGASYITGLLPAANGGTGDDTSGTTGVPYITAGNWQYESQLSSARGGTGSDLSGATQGSVAYFSSTGIMSALAPGTSGYVLQTNGAGQNPTWVSAAALGTNYWQRNAGTLSPLNITDDLLVGGTATSSAKFQIFGNTGNATTSGTLTLNSAGSIQTTNNQTLTIGGTTTGNITLAPQNGNGTVTSTGNLNLVTGKAYQINGANVLTSTALGTSVVSSSLTSVGALTGGSIASGFGTIATANTITGTTLNGTTGINTGAGAGTQRIDASGNLSNIGTINASGAITFTNLGAGVVKSSAGGLLSSSAVDLASGDVTGTLPINRGGTNSTATPTNGGVAYGTGTAYAFTGAGTSGQVLQSNGAGAPTWVDAAGVGTNYWQRNVGTLSPLNITDDLLVGGTSTASAKFQIFGNTGNASTSGTLTLNSAGSIQTTNNQTLTIGGASTGNITLAPQNGNGTVTSTGNFNLSSGKVYQINGSNVLTSTALGSGVVSSSLTSVGALSSGSIASGFGTIATANTITGTTLNGTTGINTGAGAGTQRIDASGNLLNIGTINASGAITFSNLGTGVVQSNGSGLLSSAALNLAGGSSYISGILPTANGGTGDDTSGTTGVPYISSGNWQYETQLSSARGGTGADLSAAAQGSVPYFSATGVMSALAPSTAGYVLQTNGAGQNPSWVSAAALGTNYWQRNSGTLSPLNITDDLLVGGTATSSAKFQIFGNTGNATTSGSLTFNAAGSIQTTNNQTLTIGGASTGNITLAPQNGNGTVTSTGNLNLVTGKAYQINGANVLTSTALGSSVVSSSLTSVGALSSGSIASGFGTIATANTITGTTLNGTTGINTGAGAGTQRIDASGNLANIGTINASGAITFTNLGAGVVKSSAGGLLSSSAVGLNTADVTGTLPVANGGTGATSVGTAGSVVYSNGSVYSFTGAGTSGQVLQSNGTGAPTWVDSAALGTNFWQRNAGALSPLNITDDLLVGGTATSSAKFQIFGDTGNATTSGSLTLNSAGNIQTTNNQTLTIGGASTGNITLAPQNGNGTVTSTGNLSLSTGKAYQINGANVLTSTALGSTVVSSSLTSVGALTGGSIASGFGTIATGNTITGTTLNGTTGLNTGASAGTQRIDASGNLVNIGTIASTYLNASSNNVNLAASTNLQLNGTTVINSSRQLTGITGLATSLNPTVANTYALGTGTGDQFSTIYGQTIYQNGNQVCDTTGNCAGLTTTYWNQNNGALSPKNATVDFLVGGNATASAKFAVLNVNTGTPTASVSAGTNGAAYLTAAGTLQTTAQQTLTIGGATTGNIILSPQNGSGTVTSTGSLNLATGKAYQINGSNVLTETTLGSSVVTSSLTSVGALTSGSIASGFGTIATANTITGTTLNGTTGINTGAGAGTQRIDASGNLANIGTINASGAITFSNLGAGIVKSTAGGLLSSSALNLASGTEVTGTLGAGNGGTGFNTYANGDLLYGNGSTLSKLTAGANGSVLTLSGGVPTWAAGSTINFWQRANGSVAPLNITDDLLLGGISSASAKFAFLNNAGGTPTASISANSGNNSVFLTGAGNLGTTNKQTLTLGGSTTGNIAMTPSLRTTIKPVTDSTTAFEVQSAGNSTPIFNVDAVNRRIGIGTATPSYSLNIESITNAIALLQGTSTTSYSGFYLRTDTGTFELATGGSGTSDAGRFYIYDSASGQYRLTLDSSGDLGIGMSGNATYKLDVVGDINTSTGFRVGGVAGVTSTCTGGQVLQNITTAGGIVTGGSCASGGGTNLWQLNSGALSPANSTNDLLLGGTATSSAKFAFLNNAGGTPTASISANSGNNAAFLTGAGNLGTTNNQSLSLGGATTGNILLNSDGSNFVGIGTTTPLATLDVRATSGTIPSASISGATSFAGLIVDNSGVGDLFTASKSGATKFAVLNNGNVQIANLTTAGGVLYTNGSGTVAQTAQGTSGQCLQSQGVGGAPVWGSCDAPGSVDAFTTANGLIYNGNQTLDFAFGGTTSASAKFKLSMSGTQPTASISAATANAGLIVDNRGTGDLFAASSSGLNRFVVKQNGNVGVGTTTPTAKLEVATGGTGTGFLLSGGAGGSSVNYNAGSAIFTANSQLIANWDGATIFEAQKGGVAVFTVNSSGNIVARAGTDATNAFQIQSRTGAFTIFDVDSSNRRVGIGTTTPLATLDVRSTSGTIPTASISGATSFAGLIVDNSGVGDLFTASKSGATKFAINNAGDVRIANLTTAGGVLYTNGSGTVAQTAQGTSGQCLQSQGVGGAPVWGSCDAPGSVDAFTTANGIIYNGNQTTDFVFGGTSSSSAKFKVSPSGTSATASVSGMTSMAALVVNNDGTGDIFTASKSGATKFVIKNNGNVGIGTFDPGALLELRLPGTDTGNIMRFGNTTNGIWGAYALSATAMQLNGGSNTGISLGSNNSTDRFVLDTNGRIGIGTGTNTTLATLDVRGQSGTLPVASVSGSTSNAGLIIDNNGNGDILTASKSGKTFFTVKNNGVIQMGNSTDGISFDYLAQGGTNTGVQYFGQARPTKQIVLSPEYAGGILTASGSATTDGDITADASASATALITLNGVANNYLTYYEWNSIETSLQDYTVGVRVTLPPDFSSWAPGGSSIQVVYNTELTTNTGNKVDMILYPSNSSTPTVYRQANTSATAKTWTTINVPATDLNDGTPWNAASQSAMLYFKMSSKDGNHVQLGDIILNYLSKF